MLLKSHIYIFTMVLRCYMCGFNGLSWLNVCYYGRPMLEGPVCRIDLVVELGIAVQIQNIGVGFFTRPLLRLEPTQAARLTTPITNTKNARTWRWMTWNTLFSANWQPGVLKCNWVNWQWAGFTNQKRETDIPARNAHFQMRITDCSIVFQINKYVNLTCFLNICKHIMVFLCFSRVKNLRAAPLIKKTWTE